MARGIQNQTNVDAPNADFPSGRVRDDSAPGSNDGTPANENLLGDIFQFFDQLMRGAGLTFNNLADSVTNGFQLYEALRSGAVGGDGQFSVFTANLNAPSAGQGGAPFSTLRAVRTGENGMLYALYQDTSGDQIRMVRIDPSDITSETVLWTTSYSPLADTIFDGFDVSTVLDRVWFKGTGGVVYAYNLTSGAAVAGENITLPNAGQSGQTVHWIPSIQRLAIQDIVNQRIVFFDLSTPTAPVEDAAKRYSINVTITGGANLVWCVNQEKTAMYNIVNNSGAQGFQIGDNPNDNLLLVATGDFTGSGVNDLSAICANSQGYIYCRQSGVSNEFVVFNIRTKSVLRDVVPLETLDVDNVPTAIIGDAAFVPSSQPNGGADPRVIKLEPQTLTY